MAAKSMNRSGYNVRLAAGTITAGVGPLGILIPPSIMLVVMGPIINPCNRFIRSSNFSEFFTTLYAAYTTIRCMMDQN